MHFPSLKNPTHTQPPPTHTPFQDAVDDCEECIVHFPTLKKLAEKVGASSQTSSSLFLPVLLQ